MPPTNPHPAAAPAGYAVLHYNGANEALPPTPTPQPQSAAPWTLQQAAQIVMSSALLQARLQAVACLHAQWRSARPA